MSPFVQGFLWIHPAPHHRAFHQWINGMAASCTLILCAIPAIIFAVGFFLGRAQ